MTASQNRKPTHPGAILREDVLPALGLSPREFAKLSGLRLETINELLNESSGLTCEDARNLAAALKRVA